MRRKQDEQDVRPVAMEVKGAAWRVGRVKVEGREAKLGACISRMIVIMGDRSGIGCAMQSGGCSRRRRPLRMSAAAFTAKAVRGAVVSGQALVRDHPRT